MEIKLLLSIGCALLLGIIIYLSNKQGKQAEKIKRLKEEINRMAKEQEYVQSKTEFVRDLSSNDVDDRLRKIASKKQ